MPITTAGTAWFLVKTEDRDAINHLIHVLTLLPAVKEVTVRTCFDDPAHNKIIVNGTDRGKRLALEVAKIAKAYEPDHNADHDHAQCIASAAAMGVPEAYAHAPETYRSM